MSVTRLARDRNQGRVLFSHSIAAGLVSPSIVCIQNHVSRVAWNSERRSSSSRRRRVSLATPDPLNQRCCSCLLADAVFAFSPTAAHLLEKRRESLSLRSQGSERRIARRKREKTRESVQEFADRSERLRVKVSEREGLLLLTVAVLSLSCVRSCLSAKERSVCGRKR